LSRVLDSVSHRAVLERGFALVRGAGGDLRRSAAAVKPGEALTLVFADGEALAAAGDGKQKPQKAKKPAKEQGSLF
jgi:exodeoxyribonuclease VII large subunit